MEDLDAVVQERLDNDNEFQDSIKDLSDEEKETETEKKRKEVTKEIFAEVNEKAKKAEQVANDQRGRAEKAEAKVKELTPGQKKETETEAKEQGLSTTDVYALVKADVPQEDVETVKAYAEFKKISISEALKDQTLKAILTDDAEKRRSSAAAATGANRRGTARPTAEKVVADLKDGKIPEPGSPEAEELYWARRGGRRK